MFNELYSVVEIAGATFVKIVPITIVLGVVIAALTTWSACNPGRPWWRMREIPRPRSLHFVHLFAVNLKDGAPAVGPAGGVVCA